MQDHPPVAAGEQLAKLQPSADNFERLIRLTSVLQTVQIGRTMWLDLVRAGKAPASVKIGRATFWQMSEIQAWIAARVRDSKGGR
jgi:predicted DNA-binding transcriptional regulator AlpA